MKILGIGNAIVDVICKVNDNFIEQNKLTKSTMKLFFDENDAFAPKFPEHVYEENVHFRDFGRFHRFLRNFVKFTRNFEKRVVNSGTRVRGIYLLL